MDDHGKRDIDVLRERIGNGLSPVKPKPAVLPKDHSGTEVVSMAQPEVLSAREQSSDLDFLIDEDSGSEYGDVVVPTKRKRRTNNSFALGLDDDDDSEITLPPPAKRLQFNPNGKENSVLIGVWKDSPPPDLAKKHAVYAFLDSADKVRQKVYPETRDGEALNEGYPSGTGRVFVPPEYVILDLHLSALNRQEIKEYVRLRMHHRPNESPEERKAAEALAVEEAKKVALKNTPIATPRSAPNIPTTPSKSAQLAPQNTPKGGIPNGVFLGFWSRSGAVKDADKHAAFAVVDSNRMRVKIVKFTRDGRPCQGNFPVNQVSNWIPFDDVVREPALENMLRKEVIEYVKIRQNEQGRPDFNPFGVDPDSIKQAIKTFAAMAEAQGVSAAKLDAQMESSRKAHNQSRAAQKAGPTKAKGSKYVSPYGRSNSENSRAQDAEMDGKFATTPKGLETTGSRESFTMANSLKTNLSVPKSNASGAIAGAPKNDAPEGKAKAIRSKKAAADATAEMLRRVRETAVKAKENAKANEGAKGTTINDEVRAGKDREETSEGRISRAVKLPKDLARQVKETDQAMLKRDEERARTMEDASGHSAGRTREAAKQGDGPRQGDSMTARQRAMKEAEAREGELKAKEAKEREAREREAAQARAEMEKSRAEIEKAKADAIESVSNEFFGNTDSFEERTNVRSAGHHTVGPSSPTLVTPTNRPRTGAEVKFHNDVKYVREDRGAFAGKLVGEKKEFLTIDGENYVECRILMKLEF